MVKRGNWLAWLCSLMQVTRVKIRQSLQIGPIQDLDGGTLPGQQAFSAQFLKHPIHVNRRKSHGISQFTLCYRQGESFVLRAADHIEAQVQFADEVRHVRNRGETTHDRKPLPVDGSIYQRC
jgi:hypothetical protein